VLREMLNNNIKLEYREDEDVIKNNSFKENLDKVLKKLES
jgi:hypothetical protein